MLRLLDPPRVRKIRRLKDRVKKLEAALEPFAEDPDSIDRPGEQTFSCHVGICDKFKCGRCSRAIEAWRAIHD